jgi:RHS repeat-associated protein
MPFGEAFVDEHSTTTTMPYKFNGKEQDAETGLYYYGARYYDPKICVWYGVDPLVEKYPNVGGFVYCNNNPVRFVDPDGRTGVPSFYINGQGFWVEGDSDFGEYIGNVAPNTSSYKELTKIDGTYYHKNTGNVFAKVGNMLGGNFVEHKTYSSAEENFWNEMMYEALGLGALKVGGIAFKALKSAGGSIWKLPSIGMGSRGFVYEQMLGLKGLMKSHNFPVIDAFYNGVATSVKTLNVFAKSYNAGNKLYKTLAGYVEDLSAFNGRQWGDDIVRGSDIKSKVLEVGIPRGASSEQVKQINNAIKYAADKGIEMNVRVVN